MEEDIQSVTCSEWNLVQRRLDDLENIVTDFKSKLEILGGCKCNRSNSYLESQPHSDEEETETRIGLNTVSCVTPTAAVSNILEVGGQSTIVSEEIMTLAVGASNNTTALTSTNTTGSSLRDNASNAAANGTPISMKSTSRFPNGVEIYDLEKYRRVEIKLKRCDQVEVMGSSSSSTFRSANNESQLTPTNMEVHSSKRRPVVRRTGNGPRRELTSIPPSSHKKRFVCHFCSRGFHGKSNLTEHIRVHTGDKPFLCNICSKAFTQKSALKSHARVHTGDKPFHCNICSKAFAQKSSLKMHTRIHSGDKPFECGFCSKKFSQSSNLRIHKRVHTGEKPFECGFCAMKFSASQNLVMHVRSHTGERPYTCQFCSKEFTGLGNLQVHLRVHTREKPYSCTFCPKVFTQSNHLDKHLNIHAGETPQ